MNRVIPIGASLVEIMVAITLSLFLIAGVIKIVISNKHVYRLNTAYSELQENSRLIGLYLPKILRLSGYRTPVNDTTFPTLASLYPSSAPHIQVNNNSGNNHSDVLTVRYQGSADATVTDCLNQAVGANIIATNVFSINANNELQCQATNPTLGTTTTQILIPGVENMQVLYGEDINGDRQADRYVAPNFASLNINHVVSLRMSVLLRTTEEIDKTLDTNTYYLSGTTFNPTDDFRIRRVIHLTVHLRNVGSM